LKLGLTLFESSRGATGFGNFFDAKGVPDHFAVFAGSGCPPGVYVALICTGIAPPIEIENVQVFDFTSAEVLLAGSPLFGSNDAFFVWSSVSVLAA